MKKFSLFVLACGMGIFTYAQNTFQLTGEFTKDSRKAVKQLYLTYVNEFGDTLNLDSAKVKKGKFIFKGNVPEGVERVALTGFKQGKIDLFLEPGELTMTMIDADAPQTARVKGTATNELYAQFLDMVEQNSREYENKLVQFKSSLPSSVTGNSELLKTYTEAEALRYQTLQTLDIMEFIQNHLYDKLSVYLMYDYCQHFFTSYTMMRDVLEAVPDVYQTLPAYQEMLNNCRSEELKQGAYAPVVSGYTPDGKKMNTTELSGKYLLITFWASDDKASIAELTYLKQSVQAYDQLAVVCVSLDTNKDNWLSAIKANGLDQASIYNISTLQGMDSKVASWFKVKKLPHTILLNPEGKLVAEELKGEAIVTKIKRIADGIESYK